MDARITKEETALLLNLAPSRSARDVEAIRLAALRARDEAIGQALARAVLSVWRGLRATAVFLLNYPRQRAVFDQLNAMSDRELADIGLERADLARVFDEGFALPRAAPRAEAPGELQQGELQQGEVRQGEVRQGEVQQGPANSNLPLTAKAAA